MKHIRKTPIILGLISLIAIFAFGKQEKVIQIFRNGKVIQEYAIDEIDYIEVNDRLDVSEQIPDDEIWYVTSDASVYDVTQTTHQYGVKPFDRTVVSNEYNGDHGVIKFDGPVKRINDHTFGCGWASQMTALSVPDCVEYIGTGAISYTGLTTFKIPKNLKYIGAFGLGRNSNMETFTGSHVSEDGRCVIIDGRLYAFAPKGIKDYTTPDGVKYISDAFSWSDELESIKFNEGLEYIDNNAFANCINLKSVTFPASLNGMNTYAFHGCTSIEGFYGNENFHTPDNQCLITRNDDPYLPQEWQGPWLINFAGKGLSEYTIPEGIVAIEYYAFQRKPDLKSITIPNSLAYVTGYAFHQCPNIESVNGYHTSSDKKCIVFNGELQAFVARKGITSYHIPEEITRIGYYAFAESNLEEITMGDNITEIAGRAFADLYQLKSLTLSASLKSIYGNPIIYDSNLESVYMRAPLPPSYGDKQMSDFPKLKIYVPEQTYDLYMNIPQWADFKQYFVAHKYEDLDIDKYTPDYYSTDYSKNGVVEQLFTATEGNGIDIVLMGDGYSDRQIADGTYKKVMYDMANILFEEEPYKSFKNMFNVYMVNVVSLTEGYDNDGTATALGGYFGGGTHVGGYNDVCFEYAQKAIPDSRMDEALIVVAMNEDAYAGTCYMYYPSNVTGTYGSGISIAYFPTSSDAEVFGGLVRHEALGHGFAKLADEYAYEFLGAISNEEANQTVKWQNDWGWCKNVDFTSDTSAVRWRAFINDSRYSNENIGAYEGGMTYWNGVWRPTENSIMRYNTGGFNAPSREAIYYRIHKLAYGDSWTYNYEDFVNYDRVNRTEEAIRKAKSAKPSKYAPLDPPVIVKKNWREANKSPKRSTPASIR